MEKEYRIISGVWKDREKTKAVVFVEEKDGEEIKKYDYGLDREDAAPLNKLLWEQIDGGKAELEENIYFLRLDGKAPLAKGTMIKDGEIVSIEVEKGRQRQRIRERINELYSGYETALSERDETYARNRKRKIDKLLAMEKDPDITVDILEAEDE